MINMYLVNKTEKYEVVELSTIECGVHLIPDFGPIGSTSAWREMADKGTKMPHGFDAYEKFVINNHLDPITFDMIW